MFNNTYIVHKTDDPYSLQNRSSVAQPLLNTWKQHASEISHSTSSNNLARIIDLIMTDDKCGDRASANQQMEENKKGIHRITNK